MSLGSDQPAAAEALAGPAHLTGHQLHTPEASPVFLTTITAVEEAGLSNTGVVVVGQDVITFPHLVCPVRTEPKQNGSGVVASRNEQMPIHDEGAGRVHGRLQ